MSEVYKTFTSESVTQGHPDKVADIISDAILDAYMEQDPHAHVACETSVTTDFCLVFGEVTSTANITRADIEKIREEIEHRKLVVRKEAIEAVKEARAQGDLSENFEYYAAKRDKNKNESRIRYLERIIKTATIVESDNAEDEIGLNTTVLLYFEEDDETEEITVVTTAQEDSLKGRISIESPMGKALLKHKVGDRVWIQVNKNVRYPVVVKDLRQNESVEGYKI